MSLAYDSMHRFPTAFADQFKDVAHFSLHAGLLRRATVLGALRGLLALLATVTHVSSQTTLRINPALATNASIALSWSGNAPAYEVQSAENLGVPKWRSMLVTDRTNSVVPMPGPAGYFRIVGLSSGFVPIDETQRFQILSNITERIMALPGTNGAADSQVLAAYLATFDEFIASGVTADTSTWARFRDGRLVVIVNNRPAATPDEIAAISQLGPGRPAFPVPSVPTGGSFPGAVGPSRDRINTIAIRRGTPLGIPESRNAVLFKASGLGLLSDPLKSLGPALSAHGYQMQGGEAGLFDLINVEVLGDDIGLFYIDTHGIEIQGVIPFAMLTSTWADRDTDARLKADFDRGEVAYGYLGSAILPKKGTGIAIVPKPVYCVLPPFVGRHWKFGKNSLVYMDVCDSATPNAAPFIQACAAAGASVYAGWTDAVDDWWGTYAARMTIGTLLGGKEIYDYIVPPDRPFDRVAVKNYLHRERVDISPRSNAELVVLSGSLGGNGDFGLLAPSIFHMDIDENKEELRMVGLFDPEAPATVRIDGAGTREVTVQPRFIDGGLLSANPTEIVVPMPSKQSPFAGQGRRI